MRALICLAEVAIIVFAVHISCSHAVPTSSWTCVTTKGISSCFVANCLQLIGAIESGVREITLYKDIHRTSEFWDECKLPLVISRPVTIRGACATSLGTNDGPCSMDGGGVVYREPHITCHRHCTKCVRGSKIFQVEPGGHLHLINLIIHHACNADGRGGAISLEGLPSNSCTNDQSPKSQLAQLQLDMVTIKNCISFGGIASNNVDAARGVWNGRGGAIALLNGFTFAIINDCVFQENEAWGAGDEIGDYASNFGEGGAIYMVGGIARFKECIFEGCIAEKEGGAVFIHGESDAKFEGCTFRHNNVHDDYWDGGGAVYIGIQSAASFELTRFEHNRVTAYPDSRRRAMTCGGGAVSIVKGPHETTSDNFLRGGTANFAYALFVNNSAPRGGAVCVHDGNANFRDAVFRDNQAEHRWFNQGPGNDVECVHCEFPGLQAMPLDRCRYLIDANATKPSSNEDNALSTCWSMIHSNATRAIKSATNTMDKPTMPASTVPMETFSQQIIIDNAIATNANQSPPASLEVSFPSQAGISA